MPNQEQERHLSWDDYPVPDNLPSVIINDPSLPLVSIVTPSYNQGCFIRETIESVLTQDYPNIEYWVIDGGSTDETVSIVREYEYDPRFHWISEKDKGQSDAINKGVNRSRGDIVAWINSDDYYTPNAIKSLVPKFISNPSVGLVFGDIQQIDQQGKSLGKIVCQTSQPQRMLSKLVIPTQPSCFFRMSAWKSVGMLNSNLHYVMDFDIILKIMSNYSFSYVPSTIAMFRVHGESKTSTAAVKFARELDIILQQILVHREQYPSLAFLSDGELKSSFYRLISKHLYLGNNLWESLKYMDFAYRSHQASLSSIICNEGIRWVIRGLLPIEKYRYAASLVYKIRHGTS